MQQAFHENHALQCGFCTPGMIMQALDLLKENPNPTEQEIRDGPRGQPVPVHRLPEHRQGRAACASTMADGGGAVEDDSVVTAGSVAS